MSTLCIPVGVRILHDALAEIHLEQVWATLLLSAIYRCTNLTLSYYALTLVLILAPWLSCLTVKKAVRMDRKKTRNEIWPFRLQNHRKDFFCEDNSQEWVKLCMRWMLLVFSSQWIMGRFRLFQMITIECARRPFATSSIGYRNCLSYFIKWTGLKAMK